jgi:putative sterol carrier protein
VTDKELLDRIRKKLIEKSFNFEIDIEDYFIVTKNILQSDPEFIEEIKDVNEVYQITITETNLNFWIEISNGKIDSKVRAVHPNPTVGVFFSQKVFEDIIFDRINASVAFMEGKIQVRGSTSKALFLRRLIVYVNAKLLE